MWPFSFQPQPTDDTHGTPSYRQRLRLVADPYILELTMKFSELPESSKERAREALCAFIRNGEGSSKVKIGDSAPK